VGALIAGTDQAEPLPPGTEERVASFAKLIGTAVSNATARTELIASRARMIPLPPPRGGGSPAICTTAPSSNW
jgi:hypothetical protein